MKKYIILSKLAYFFISLHFLSVYFHFGSHSFGLIYFSRAHFAHDCCSHINAYFDIFAAAIFIQLFIFLYYSTKNQPSLPTPNLTSYDHKGCRGDKNGAIDSRDGHRCRRMEVLVESRNTHWLGVGKYGQ